MDYACCYGVYPEARQHDTDRVARILAPYRPKKYFPLSMDVDVARIHYPKFTEAVYNICTVSVNVVHIFK